MSVNMLYLRNHNRIPIEHIIGGLGETLLGEFNFVSYQSFGTAKV
jgi:hypothetical protein